MTLARTPVTVIGLRGNTRFLNADDRDRINPGARTGLSNGYGAVGLSLKQRQRITGNAFSNDMLWGVFFQYTMQPPALHIIMMSDIACPYPAMSAEQAEEALSRMAVLELFAKNSSMVELGFVPRIPVFVEEGYDIIPFQTRAPGAVPAKLQISADYKVEFMARSGTYKRISYSKDVYLMLIFFKPKLQVEVAEFDGPNWKAGDELLAL